MSLFQSQFRALLRPSLCASSTTVCIMNSAPLSLLNFRGFSKKKGNDGSDKSRSSSQGDSKNTVKLDQDGQLDMNNLKTRFAMAKEALMKDLSTLRPGRASANLLDGVQVATQKNRSSLLSIANITVQNAQTLLVQPFDVSHIKEIEKAVRSAGLGLNPVVEGESIKVPIPKMTLTHRQDMIKTANNYGEETKNTIRKLRRACMDDIKGMKGISEDAQKKFEKNIDKVMEGMVKEVADILKAKEKELNTH
eukprot:TRINITY_DN20701_c0_g1_i1.p1 TRINITY_DN20701_c0_g1~~TRINITY_DN20701_c0_g1_i1.p1  ORF type:complete len:250 (+),score=68.91 TRINITY_DN20701_c0_g1_i1:50-799(+)